MCVRECVSALIELNWNHDFLKKFLGCDCLKCKLCNLGFDNGRYSIIDNDFYHIDCENKLTYEEVICFGCNKNIFEVLARYNDDTYHPKCLKCLRCQISVTNEISIGDFNNVGPYCFECLDFLYDEEDENNNS